MLRKLVMFSVVLICFFGYCGIAFSELDPNSPQDQPKIALIANTRTGIYHYPSCRMGWGLPKEYRRVYGHTPGDYSEILQRHYKPCKECLPPTPDQLANEVYKYQ
jgi:hypothetical protein